MEKKKVKCALVTIMTVMALLTITLVIVYVVYPNKIRRLLILASSNMEIFVDRLKGRPYTVEGYDGIDVSKHNGVIKWDEVAKNENVKFVYIKATEGKNHTDRRYSWNIRDARKAGLKVGSYHFFTSSGSATAQFAHFSTVVRKEEQDLIPVLDVEASGIKGKWNDKQLQDSIWTFLNLAKKHYGKYPIIYSNEHFYNHQLGHVFDDLYLFIANYKSRPRLMGRGKHNIWQYTERGHLKGIGEYVDLNRLDNGMTVENLMW